MRRGPKVEFGPQRRNGSTLRSGSTLRKFWYRLYESYFMRERLDEHRSVLSAANDRGYRVQSVVSLQAMTMVVTKSSRAAIRVA